jgi:hypothetical protein
MVRYFPIQKPGVVPLGHQQSFSFKALSSRSSPARLPSSTGCGCTWALSFSSNASLYPALRPEGQEGAAREDEDVDAHDRNRPGIVASVAAE